MIFIIIKKSTLFISERIDDDEDEDDRIYLFIVINLNFMMDKIIVCLYSNKQTGEKGQPMIMAKSLKISIRLNGGYDFRGNNNLQHMNSFFWLKFLSNFNLKGERKCSN